MPAGGQAARVWVACPSKATSSVRLQGLLPALVSAFSVLSEIYLHILLKAPKDHEDIQVPQGKRK